MALTTADLVEIQMVIAHYGHILDERDWDALPEIFTEDIVFDGTDSGLGVMRGIPEIVENWQEPFGGHPLGHHTTNVYVYEDSDGTVRAHSKHLGPRAGTVTLMTYEDVLSRTPDGWRLAERVTKIHHRIPMHEAPARRI